MTPNAKTQKNKVQDVQAHQQREKGIKPKLKIKNSEKKKTKNIEKSLIVQEAQQKHKGETKR